MGPPGVAPGWWVARPLWSLRVLPGGVRGRGERDPSVVVGGPVAAGGDPVGRGGPLRGVPRWAGAHRKTVRRYVEAAQAAGVDRDDGPAALSDELLGAVIAA